jgi:predicted  nucleic acid-binding Zn-ribbon protein
LTEEERLTAWRAHRKSELEKVLANIQAEIEDNLKYAAALAKAKENVEEKISTNDAMTFATGIDPEKTPESGD